MQLAAVSRESFFYFQSFYEIMDKVFRILSLINITIRSQPRFSAQTASALQCSYEGDLAALQWSTSLKFFSLSIHCLSFVLSFFHFVWNLKILISLKSFFLKASAWQSLRSLTNSFWLSFSIFQNSGSVSFRCEIGCLRNFYKRFFFLSEIA